MAIMIDGHTGRLAVIQQKTLIEASETEGFGR
jgi:hypothetical protein